VRTLTWRSSGGPSADEESEYRNPSGPKAAPGMYQVRLTVNGETQNQPLQVIMDPRSPATPETLQKQLELAQQIYAETLEARRVLAEIGSVQKKLTDALKQLGEKHPALKSALVEAQGEIEKILTTGPNAAGQAPGLQDAYTGAAAALRVVESGDRAVPSQGIALNRESSEQIKAHIAEWTSFKQSKLPQLNRKLRDGMLAPIAISEIEREVDSLISR
jgi:hypothetical protein